MVVGTPAVASAGYVQNVSLMAIRASLLSLMALYVQGCAGNGHEETPALLPAVQAWQSGPHASLHHSCQWSN